MFSRTLCQISRSLLRTSAFSSTALNPIVPAFHLSKFTYSTAPTSDIPKFYQETVLDAGEEKKLAEDVITQVSYQNNTHHSWLDHCVSIREAEHVWQ